MRALAHYTHRHSEGFLFVAFTFHLSFSAQVRKIKIKNRGERNQNINRFLFICFNMSPDLFGCQFKVMEKRVETMGPSLSLFSV